MIRPNKALTKSRRPGLDRKLTVRSTRIAPPSCIRTGGRRAQGIQKDLRLRSPEGIDTLLDVTHSKDLSGTAESVEDGLLDGIDVLVFIHKKVPVPIPQGQGRWRRYGERPPSQTVSSRKA